MPSRVRKYQGKRAYVGGKISEGKFLNALRGYKLIGRRIRVGGREIDGLVERGNIRAHVETTKTIVTLPKLQYYWNKYLNTRIATGANRLYVHGGGYTQAAKKFAKKKGIRLF